MEELPVKRPLTPEEQDELALDVAQMNVEEAMGPTTIIEEET